MGCAWRNTTNATACMSAQVAEYQHAVAWDPANPLELFVGNDGGLWRSSDGIAESGPVCSASDASHFQNLNGALGSLAEVDSMSPIGGSPYTMMLGLGANGTAGVKSTTGPTIDWPQILTGEGGPVAIDPTTPANWYVNNGPGVSIHLCSQSQPCTPGDFGSTPVVTNADVNGDGLIMPWPAPFLVDPVDSSQLLIGTCRVWRGPANGIGWTSANALGPMFDGNRSLSYCNGNALVRSMAAMGIAGGGEVVYVGMYGSQDGGATLPGHVLTASMDPTGMWSAWQDLTLNPVVNDQVAMNFPGFDISSLFIDPHDPTGNTIYATVAGIPNLVQHVRMVYRSTDGGAHWSDVQSNLPASAANSVVVDPQDANTAYIATDAGVYITRNVTTCGDATACWSPFGSGLPDSPVVAMSAAPATTSPNVLVAGTFGRGVWQIPLATAGTQLSTAGISPAALDFGTQGFGISSGAQLVTLTNTGGIALLPGPITITGDFSETDNCANSTVNSQASCAIQVKFRPTRSGSRTGQLSISANVAGGKFTVALSGTGATPGVVNLRPPSIDFGQVQVGSTSNSLPVTAENTRRNRRGDLEHHHLRSICAGEQFLRNHVPGGQHRLPVAGGVCAHGNRPGNRRVDAGGRRGNADGAIDRHRSGATDRHAVGHVADVRGNNHRTVFVSADGDVDQQRRSAADFNCSERQRAISTDEQLHRPTGGQLPLFAVDRVYTDAGGDPDRIPHNLRQRERK